MWFSIIRRDPQIESLMQLKQNASCGHKHELRIGSFTFNYGVAIQWRQSRNLARIGI
ncbi:hypothetical protein Ancab_005924, partial [Ancistrocladus abbreviatus]